MDFVIITNTILVLVKLGRRLNIRQIVLASAEIYLTRFLTRVLLKEVNAYLLVTTCIYVASKIEECPQHIRLILCEARNLWPEYIPHDNTKLAEFEFYLIEEMDLFLFLYHPYRSIVQIRDFLIENESIYGFTLTDDELQNSWSIINDSYITDLHLLFPPHIIAVTAIYITIVLKKNLRNLQLANTNINSNFSSTSPNKQNDVAMDLEDLVSLSTGNSDSNNKFGNNTNKLPTEQFQDIQTDENTIKINKFMNFLNHSHINLDEIVEAMQDIINLYVVWNRYNENNVKKALQNMLLNRQ